MFSINNPHRLILGVLIFITLVMGILIFKTPPALFPDPSAGLQVMRNMQMGGGFNVSITPSQSDITQNTSTFLTWWSPGQYLTPYAFTKLFGTNQGQSSALTVLLCDLLGVLGFYSLFRKVGFEQKLSALSVAFIVCQQFYAIPYVFYNGGETLLFGFLGWFLYGCFSFERFSWPLFVFIILSGWIGFFCKSAFLWMYASGIFCLLVQLSSGRKDVVSWIKNGILLAIPAGISLAVLYVTYISKGANPSSAVGGPRMLLDAFAFPLASPLLSGFSVDELTNGLVYHQDKVLFSPAAAAAILIVAAVLSIALFVVIIRKVPNPKYKLVLSAFYVVAILFFTSSFLKRLNISFEGRHFRIVGLLFIPGALYLFTRLKQPLVKGFFILLWVGITAMSVKYFVAGYKFNTRTSAHGPSGVSQQFIDQPSLNYLLALDKAHHDNALFVFTSPDLGLEILHNRIISLDQFDDMDAHTYVENNEYNGHAGPLYILLPASYIKTGNVVTFEQCFPQYGNFSVKRLSKDYILVSAL